MGLAIALLGALTGPVELVGPTTPAAASTTTLTSLGTLDHRLTGMYATRGTSEAYSTPAMADITGDGTPELVVASIDGTVEAFRLTDRTRLWSRSLGATAIEASPVIADLGGDGKADVVIGTMDGRVVWLDGPTGAVARTFHQGDPLHCSPGSDCRPDGFFATPAVADVNGDAIPDIVAPSWDHTVYAWSRGGTLLWRRYLEDTLWSSPVVTDIDRDGRPEIVLGGDIWAGNPLGKPEGGLVWILRRDGSTYPGYPKSVPGQTVWSSPAVGDLNRDGFPDVIVGSGTNWADPAGRKVQAFTAKTGGNLPGWPVTVEGRVMSSPALGDLDGDDGLEVAVASEGGYVYAFDSSGARLWRVCNAVSQTSCTTGYNTHGSVAIADVDADGRQEVVSALDKDLRVYDPRTGGLEASFRLTSGRTLPPVASPAIGQVNGKTVIAQASIYRSGTHGGGPATGDLTRIDLLVTGTGLCRSDWPTFHHDARRSGAAVATHDGWYPFLCPATFVSRQYRDFLGRTLDASGSAYWTGRLLAGTTGSQVIRSVMGSNEFGGVVAPVVRASLGVRGTYPASADEVQAQAAALRQGATAAEVADAFADDPKITALDDAAFVRSVFDHLYGRAPTATELARDVARLAGGASRGTVVAGYAEGSAASRLTAEVNVAMVYLGMLGRAPDSGGWAYWVPIARTRSVDALVVGFQHSTEYVNRVT